MNFDRIMKHKNICRDTLFKISLSVESYDEKSAKNGQNCYVAEKRIVSKLSKISIKNFDSINWRLELRFCENFTSVSSKMSEK